MTYLNADETASLDALIVRLESATGVQIVPAIVGRADSYAEVPWKAFALGASMAALVLVASDLLRPQWVTASTAAMHAFVILGAGGACALLASFVPSIARLLFPWRSLAIRRRTRYGSEHAATSFSVVWS